MTTAVDEQIDYTERTATWRTPRGRDAVFTHRAETSDWNTIQSICAGDEYGLAALRLSGLALDIGAHLGAATVALALDNPDLDVIAVEAIAENAELAERNVRANGLEDRVTVICAAASKPGTKKATVRWRGTGNENVEHHAFIGNSSIGEWNFPHQSAKVACVSLSGLLGDRDAAFLKIDCEGCEWGALADPAVSRIALIHGEWHPTEGHTRDDLLALLADTHDVTFTGPVQGPGGFVAVRRG